MMNKAKLNEAELKGRLGEAFKAYWPGAVWLRHEDHFTAGIPDVSITGAGRTSWLEVKHLNPKLRRRTLQELTMVQLQGAGFAWFILYDDRGKVPLTRVVTPSVMFRKLLDTAPDAASWPHYAHQQVVEFIREKHEGKHGS